MKAIIEPFRIKCVEPIRMSSVAERKKHMEKASYNLFSLRAEHVLIDRLEAAKFKRL
jgi:tryptophanase